MRIFFIHGLGENPGIFKNIAPAIGAEQMFLDVWKLLGNGKQEDLNVFEFSKRLVSQYNITDKDLVIGHSMGGWIAYYIKHHTNCRIVQISSSTNQQRIVSPVRSPKIIYWLAYRNLILNKFQKWITIKTYKNLPSKQIVIETCDNLINGNRECIVSQLRIVFEPAPVIDAIPELRIHALKDPIVKHPLESFYEVPGDHYSLITYPKEVLQPILALLKDTKE